MVNNSDYIRKKSALQKQLEDFLATYCNGKCILTANPRDVTRFLVSKDVKGKTQVHDLKCKNLGKIGMFPCLWPCMLAAGTIKSYLGQLKPIFLIKW